VSETPPSRSAGESSIDEKGTSRSRVTSNRSLLIIILVVTLVYRATNNMLQTSVPLFAKYALGLNDFSVSVVVAISNVAALLGLVYFGFTRVRLRRTILFALVVVSCSIPLLLVIHDAASLTLLYSFIMFSTSAVLALLTTAVVVIALPGGSEKNILLYMATLSLGLVVGPILQGFLLAVSNQNLTYSMVLFVPPMLAGTALFYLVRLNDTEEVGEKFRIRVVRNSKYWVGVLANESYSFPYTAIIVFGGIFARSEVGASYAEVEILLTVLFVTSLGARLFLLRMRRWKYPLMISSLIFSGLGLLVIYFSSSMAVALMGFVLLGYSHGISYPVATSYIATAVAGEDLAAANMMSQLIDGTVLLGATPIIGAVAEAFSLRTSFLFSLLPTLAIGSAFILLSKRRNT
jgi:DHA1 family multidrug resistance protein-like MFS transporter